MRWVRVETGLYRNAKFHDLPRHNPRAVVAWLGGLLLCGEQETDGRILTSQLEVFRARQPDVDALVQRGLWVPVDGGYVIHDWADYQPTLKTSAELREQNRKAARARWDRARRDAP